MSGKVHWSYPILPFGIVACTVFPTAFLEIAVFDNLAMWGRWLNGRCTKIAIVQVLAYQKKLPKLVQGVKINLILLSEHPEVHVPDFLFLWNEGLNFVTHQPFYTLTMRTSTRPWCRPVFTQLQRWGLEKAFPSNQVCQQTRATSDRRHVGFVRNTGESLVSKQKDKVET